MSNRAGISVWQNEFLDNLEWLKSLGVRVASQRADQTLRTFQSLLQQIATTSHIDPSSEDIASLMFAEELIYVRKSNFENGNSRDEFIMKIQSAISGPIFIENEDSSRTNQPRNTMFELYVASMFSRAGLLIDLGEGADIVAHGQNSTFIIECKRPYSVKGFDDCIRHGIAQLRGKLSISEESLGIIALDVSRSVAGEDILVMGSNELSITERARNLCDQFIPECNRILRKRNKLERLVALLLLVRFPALEQSKSRFTCVRVPYFAKILHDGHPYLDELTKVVKKLRRDSDLRL